MGKTVEICFLPSLTLRHSTQRDHELAQSSARSHVAKLIHRARAKPTTKATRAYKRVRSIDIEDEDGLPSDSRSCGLESANVADVNVHIYQRTSAEENAEHLDTTGCLEQDPRLDPSSITPKSITSHDRNARTIFQIYRPSFWRTVSDKLADPHDLHLFQYSTVGVTPGYSHDVEWQRMAAASVAQANSADDVSASCFHGNMWHAAVHRSIKSNKPIIEPQSIMHYQRAMHHISRHLQRDIQHIEEFIIMAIITLATVEPCFSTAEKKASHGFQSPFPRLQWINVVSQEPMHSSHWNAICRVVDLRGGIDCLNSFVVDYALQFLDVVDSTIHLSLPHWPVSQRAENAQNGADRRSMFGFADMMRTCHSHILDEEENSITLKKLRIYGLSVQLHQVCEDLRVWTKVISSLAEGSHSKLDLTKVAHHRNIIQHRLLMAVFDSTSNFEGCSRMISVTKRYKYSGAINQVFSTALLIYSTGVTFPTRNHHLHKTLAQVLKSQLVVDSSELQTSELRPLRIWLGTMGFLASMQASCKNLKLWFIKNLVEEEQRCTSEIGCQAPSAWSDVKRQCLVPILWSDEACDRAAQTMWEEVQLILQ